jgi:hypothetical protein
MVGPLATRLRLLKDCHDENSTDIVLYTYGITGNGARTMPDNE